MLYALLVGFLDCSRDELLSEYAQHYTPRGEQLPSSSELAEKLEAERERFAHKKSAVELRALRAGEPTAHDRHESVMRRVWRVRRRKRKRVQMRPGSAASRRLKK
eukprot:6187047-Pleurochrysis_carterae.AAC.1